MNSGETWYEILEISNSASAEEVKQAYFDLARRYHPDTNQNELAKEWFFQIQEAYETLIDPQKRRIYDESIKHRKNIKDQLSISIKTSTEKIPRLKEPQLVYVMIELSSLVEPEKIKTPQGHICLVIDRSTSMKGNRIEMVKENILRLVNQLKPKDSLSIVTFSDKADVLLTPTRIEEIKSIKEKLDQITCSGSTEIYKGLKAGADLLWGSSTDGTVRQMILLTDGHTYGDEEECYQLAQKLQTRGIRLSTLGLGHEWNDKFLDRLASLTGSSSTFVTDTDDLRNYINKIGNSISVTSADGLLLDFYSDEGVKTDYIFRLQPEVTELPLENPIPIGGLFNNQKSIYILSFTVPGIQDSQKDVQIIKGKIRYEMVAPINRKMRTFINLRLPIEGHKINDNPPKEFLEALSRISIYQMQEKANTDVKNGNLNRAIGRLGSISTQLFKQGNPEMAMRVIKEAESLKSDKKYSMDGDKQLKYGTRALIAPEVEKSEP